MSNKCTVQFVTKINEYLATFKVGYEVHPGDSGTIIFHEGLITRDSAQDVEQIDGQVPLYMIVARSKVDFQGDDTLVLATYLPYLLKLGREEITRQFDIKMQRPYTAATHMVIATAELLKEWEFVCTKTVRTNIQESVNNSKRKG